jgi:hypothetical protein
VFARHRTDICAPSTSQVCHLSGSWIGVDGRLGDLLLPDALELFDVAPAANHVDVSRIRWVGRRVACCRRMHPRLDDAKDRQCVGREVDDLALRLSGNRRGQRRQVERVELRVVKEEASRLEGMEGRDVDNVSGVKSRIEVDVDDD